MEFRDSTYTLMVRGLVENVPKNSTIQFDVLAPLSLLEADLRNPEAWGRRMFLTYARLNQHVAPYHTGCASTARS